MSTNEIRYRRAAERGQIHPVQRHHQRGRRRRPTIPFCTIEPNVGMVAVPDERLDVLRRACTSPKKYTPAVIEFVDIAGLVKGASKGEGLGNKFLGQHPRHATRSSTSCAALTTRTSSTLRASTDPKRDIDIIDLELIMADLEMVERRIDKALKAAKGDKKFMHEADVFKALLEHLNNGKSRPQLRVRRGRRRNNRDERPADLEAHHLRREHGRGRRRALCRQHLLPDRRRASRPKRARRSCRSAPRSRRRSRSWTPEDKLMFLEELGLEESGLDRHDTMLLRAAGSDLLPDLRQRRVPRLDDPPRARRLRRRRVRSTAILSAASSARR